MQQKNPFLKKILILLKYNIKKTWNKDMQIIENTKELETLCKTLSDEDFVTYLLENAGVAVVQGAAFGMSPFFRLSYAAAMESLQEACQRIVTACRALR